MTLKKKKEREARMKEMNKVLRKLYPKATIALVYNNPWELLVAVELSAQCTDERVNKVTEKLFQKYKTLDAYVNAKPNEFEKDIFQCGFYKNKTKNILAAAKMVKKDFGGVVPTTMRELLTIPGVARKTANVIIAVLGADVEGIAVDTHVRRFAIRFDLSDYMDPVRIERDLMEIMPKKEWWGFNHRLVHYGRDYCPARKHDCKKHPLTQAFPDAADIWPKAR